MHNCVHFVRFTILPRSFPVPHLCGFHLPGRPRGDDGRRPGLGTYPPSVSAPVINGPIDMFPFLGARQGKDAVLEVIRQLADNFQVRRFDRESIMLGIDSAASMVRYSLTALDSSKPISLRVAQFAQFRAGKLVSMRVLIDTFDLVEQALGRAIHLPKMTSVG